MLWWAAMNYMYRYLWETVAYTSSHWRPSAHRLTTACVLSWQLLRSRAWWTSWERDRTLVNCRIDCKHQRLTVFTPQHTLFFCVCVCVRELVRACIRLYLCRCDTPLHSLSVSCSHFLLSISLTSWSAWWYNCSVGIVWNNRLVIFNFHMFSL